MLKWMKQKLWGRFWRDLRGVSAVEFALILPVQLIMIYGTVEISNILIADRKLVFATSTTADLFAQAKTVASPDIADIFKAGTAVMQPFDIADVSFVAASVVADGAGVTRVEWSEGYAAPPLAAGAPYTLPPGIVAPNQSVMVVESRYVYHSPLGKLLVSDVPLTDRFILAPRRSIKVGRTAG